ncbi:OmpA family protein [uncultured Maribacter sp.]|uniref:OmpA family protein n=1 Tax=uncultured Maribacter sp. TaxID=431308 RepID=UPI002627E548|nr:OmpA family protein [uncultured Maribacter sp.]
MKKYIVYIVLFASFVAVGQDKYSNADKSFESLWYLEAAKQYERIIANGDHSQKVLQKVGDAYYFNTDMENASKWYEELFSRYEDVVEPKYKFRYIHALQGIGKYSLVKALMKVNEEELKASNFNVEQLKNNDEELDKLLKRQPQFYVSNLSINTKVADFGTAFYKNKIVFASSRDSSKIKTRLYKWNNQSYLNLFMADTVFQGTDLKNVIAFSKNINTKYHEAVVAFNTAGDEVYFTRNNFTDEILKRDSDGMNHLKLYHAVLENNEWVNIKEVPFNNENYSVGQPALSPDGKKLYFVSDMPGSIGATDIFVVDVLGGNSFSEPKNLGPEINTSGREMFPHLTENKIYFSSDGHLGFGGLDVFESSYKTAFSKPINLGVPLNSKKDDFGYIVNEVTQRGYVSSNRDGGVGDDDIYSFNRINVKCVQKVKGSVVNIDNGIPEDAVIVRLIEENGDEIAKTVTNVNGEYVFNIHIDCDTKYSVSVEKENFDAATKQFITSDILDYVNTVPMGIKKRSRLIVEENGILKIKIGLIYFDLDKSFIRNDATIELNKIVFLMQEYPNMVIKIESHTDSRNNDAYNEALSDRRAKSTRDYIISQGISSNRIESAIGYGEKQLVNNCDNTTKCSDSQHDVNRRSEFIIVKLN